MQTIKRKEKSNRVFIATSLDGYISDKDGGLEWLQSISNPDHNDMGYSQFMQQIDAIVMGRITFETVCNFDIDWPYTVPVFVMSSTLQVISGEHQHKAELINGSPGEVIKELNEKGYKHLYIDGGKTIQSFLREDLIDELIITTIPVLLGGGSRLFDKLQTALNFKHVYTQVYLNQIIQSYYIRKRH